MKTYLLYALVVVVSSCVNNPSTSPKNLAQNSTMIPCTGLSVLKSALGKTVQGDTAFIVKTDTVSYCSAERLYWYFRQCDSVLQLLHTRRFHTCASDVSIKITEMSDSSYHMEETVIDRHTLCDCAYDTYCELPVNRPMIKLEFENIQYNIETSKKSGSFIIDSTQRNASSCMHLL